LKTLVLSEGRLLARISMPWDVPDLSVKLATCRQMSATSLRIEFLASSRPSFIYGSLSKKIKVSWERLLTTFGGSAGGIKGWSAIRTL
jgi:uncharacterized protein (UPF0548 family)